MSISKKCGHHPDLICGCGVMPEPAPNPQHVAEFERLFGEVQGKRRSMSENTNERLDRYAEAIDSRPECEHERQARDDHGRLRWCSACDARAVMALADAEQAELLAEVERLQKDRDTAQEHVAYHLRDYSLNGEATGDLAVDMAAYSGRLRIRAEAAEAERDQARSLADTLEARLAQVEAALTSVPRHASSCAVCGPRSRGGT